MSDNEKSIEIQMDEATAQGVYINLAVVSHSETEFVLDFIFVSPNPKKAKVRSRILTSPMHAKRIMTALQDNLAKYEARFGEIRSTNQPQEPGVGFFH